MSGRASRRDDRQGNLGGAARSQGARSCWSCRRCIQLLIFTFAATLEVKNVDIGVLDRCERRACGRTGPAHRRQPAISATSSALESPRDAARGDRRAAGDRRAGDRAAISTATIAAGKPATVGLVLDGRRSNAAQIVGGYLGRIAAGMWRRAAAAHGGAGAGGQRRHQLVQSQPRLYLVHPALAGGDHRLGLRGSSITSQSVARERELGTFDQLMVSPLRVHEILIGKMVPPMLVGMFNGTLYLLVAPLRLRRAVHRLAAALLLCAGRLSCSSLIGIGMLVSAVVADPAAGVSRLVPRRRCR